MIEFTLSASKRKALPDTVMVNGSAFSVNTSFRVILRTLRLLDDESVPDRLKLAMLLEQFYGKHIPRDIEAAVKAYQIFVRRGEMTENKPSTTPPVFDFEQDAPEVYASFLSLYGLDLLESEMHWWQFSALLDGAFRVDSALSEKIKLRKLNPDKCEDPYAVREAQEAIRIETKVTRAEHALRQRLADVLTSGGDVCAALEALKHEL